MLDIHKLRVTLICVNKEDAIKQNVTASIDKDLLIMGKVIDAKTNFSLNAMQRSMLVKKKSELYTKVRFSVAAGS